MSKIKIIKRNIKYWFQRKFRCWDDSETWNLDLEFIKWVSSRFKKYKEITLADLSYHKFKYKKKTYTQGELIDKVIDLTDEYINSDYFEDKLDSIKNEIFDIFKLIFWTMWW